MQNLKNFVKLDRELKDLVFFTNVGMVLLILMFMILFLLFLTAEPD